MRKLTLSPRMSKSQIDLLEHELEVKIPEYYVEFMKNYSGLGVVENSFYNNTRLYEVSSFCSYTTIYDYSKIFKEQALGIKIPFAFDNGAWLYCISLNEADEGTVYLHNVDWTNTEDAFEKVAGSFEEFIDGLQPSEEL